MINIPERIKQLLHEKGFKSINELSRKSNVPQSTLVTLMRGHTNPRIDTIDLICQTLNINLAEFFMENTAATLIDYSQNMPLNNEIHTALSAFFKQIQFTEQHQHIVYTTNKLQSLSVSDLEALLEFIDYLYNSYQKKQYL
ncbi:MAG: Cro/C1-type DNA-binding domain [Firmicutes bacterium]|nr:Cro/C1-type DNA-binding domain [Bacillota bacterium]